jgi:hypothetical protein
MTSSGFFQSRIRSALLVLMVAVEGCEGGGPPLGPSVDSNSNWLIGRDTQADCPGDSGVRDTAFCLPPEAYEASPDEQRCIDACTESVNDHVLQLCLSNGEPEASCFQRASEHVATCRFDCASLHSTNNGPVVTAISPYPSDPPPVINDDEASDCWRTCVDSEFPELVSCRDAGGASDEECMSAFYETVNACGANCSTDAGTGDPEVVPTGIYRASWCGVQPLVESEGATRDEARANCQLTAQYNPTIDLYCTWNDEVIFDGCDASNVDVPASEACAGWEIAAFDRADEFIDSSGRDSEQMNCSGGSYSRFDARYGLWVGLVSCGAGYRFYLSETAAGPYLPAADGGGHGQDLCELVDPSFSIPVEGDITSGGCTACTISTNHWFVAGEVYGRTAFGEPFSRGEAPAAGNYQGGVIQCATGPVECGLPASPVDCDLDPLGCR